jgi:hypothetical protein
MITYKQISSIMVVCLCITMVGPITSARAGSTALEAKVFYYDSVPRGSQREVTLVQVQAQFRAGGGNVAWAAGNDPGAQLRDEITVELSETPWITGSEVHRTRILLSEVKNITVTWRDGDWTQLGVRTLDVEMKDGTRHSWTMVPAKPTDHGPHLYRCTGSDGALNKEFKGFLDIPLFGATDIPTVAVNPNTGARGVPSKVSWAFSCLTGIERQGQSTQDAPETRKYISLRDLGRIEFGTAQVGASNGSQSIGSETNRTSSAAGRDDTSQKATAVEPSVRWPRIVLEVVSEETDKKFSELFTIERQFAGRQFAESEFRGARVSAFASGKVPNIKEIIKKYGEPDKVALVPKEVDSGTKQKEDYKNYIFDNVITLQVKNGKEEVEWITAPVLWWVEGLRKKAQQELEKAR